MGIIAGILLLILAPLKLDGWPMWLFIVVGAGMITERLKIERDRA